MTKIWPETEPHYELNDEEVGEINPVRVLIESTASGLTNPFFEAVQSRQIRYPSWHTDELVPISDSGATVACTEVFWRRDDEDLAS